MTHEVTVGGQKFEIQRFKGLKAILAIASVTRISREVPNILADAVKAYRIKNTIIVTEAMRRFPQFAGFTTEDFDAAEKRTGSRQIEVPTPMNQQEQIMQALPELFEHARTEIIRLLAILITPNEELKAADKEGHVEQVLDKHSDLLLYEAEIDELADLVLKAQEVVNEQLSSKKDRLGKLIRGLWGLLRGQSTQQIPGTTTAMTDGDLTMSGTPSTPSTSKPDAPTSSTDSPVPTDGPEITPSMVSGGVS